MVVGVHDPPHARARGGVESEVLPSAPEGVNSGEGFGVLPPACGPAKGCVAWADTAGVHVAQSLTHELVSGAMEQLRFVVLIVDVVIAEALRSVMSAPPLRLELRQAGGRGRELKWRNVPRRRACCASREPPRRGLPACRRRRRRRGRGAGRRGQRRRGSAPGECRARETNRHHDRGPFAGNGGSRRAKCAYLGTSLVAVPCTAAVRPVRMCLWSGRRARRG